MNENYNEWNCTGASRIFTHSVPSVLRVIINNYGTSGKCVYYLSSTDHSYVDPMGELPERPARQKPADEDEFHDTELGEDLLPE